LFSGAIVSIPVWISARLLNGKQGRFSRVMLVTIAGPITYAIVYFITTRLLTLLLSLVNKYYYFVPSVNTVGIALGFVGWIFIFKKGFKTGWLRAVGIFILAIIVFVIIEFILSLIINQLVPSYSPNTIIPPFPFQPIGQKILSIYDVSRIEIRLLLNQKSNLKLDLSTEHNQISNGNSSKHVHTYALAKDF
jgi:ABC-type transport system involved in multi-copper enzyme maturation permease subunit